MLYNARFDTADGRFGACVKRSISFLRLRRWRVCKKDVPTINAIVIGVWVFNKVTLIIDKDAFQYI